MQVGERVGYWAVSKAKLTRERRGAIDERKAEGQGPEVPVPSKSSWSGARRHAGQKSRGCVQMVQSMSCNFRPVMTVRGVQGRAVGGE